MTKFNVKIVYMEDWEILYINDLKVQEGHSLDLFQVVRDLTGVDPVLYSLVNEFNEDYDGNTPSTFNPEGLTQLC